MKLLFFKDQHLKKSLRNFNTFLLNEYKPSFAELNEAKYRSLTNINFELKYLEIVVLKTCLIIMSHKKLQRPKLVLNHKTSLYDNLQNPSINNKKNICFQLDSPLSKKLHYNIQWVYLPSLPK